MLSDVRAAAVERGAGSVPPPRPAVSVVVPVLDAMAYLPRTVPALLAEARVRGAEVLFVDNGSTDGSYEYLQSLKDVRVLRRSGGTIGALRNHAARHARGAWLAFVDADCIVSPGYLRTALEVLARTGAAAIGCETIPPAPAHWIEAAWHALHFVGRERYVRTLFSAGLVVSRAAFEQVGGFRETLVTGEDAELGLRLDAAGYLLYESPSVAVVHLGNPRTLGAFYRRSVWHGVGMLDSAGRRLDRPTAMTLAHLALTLATPAVLPGVRAGAAAALLVAPALQLAVPAATVAFRCMQTRRVRAVLPGLLLYWLYYWSRIHALFLIATGRARDYRK